VFEGLTAVLYKELRQIRRDPASLFLALLVPLIQLTVFGYAIDTEVRDIPTLVVDGARTRSSRVFTEALNATGTFRLVGEATGREDALSRMRAGEARVVVIFPSEFDERRLAGEPAAVQVLVDGSDSSLASQAQAAALGLAADLERREAHRSAAPRYDVRPRFLYNPDGRSERFFVPGLAAIIVQLVTMILTAFAIVRERERGTLEQLLVTPISAGALTIGKILPAVLVGAAEAVIVVIAMVALFDVPIAGSVALLGAVTVLYLFTSLALGLLISAFARTQLQAMMLTMGVLLPSVLLSGFMFPRASMPPGIYELTFALPATYFIEILRGIVLRGASAAELAPFIGPLLGIGAGLAVVVAIVLRRARS
jgi:ABC-type multidrug transport system permease subunit